MPVTVPGVSMVDGVRVVADWISSVWGWTSVAGEGAGFTTGALIGGVGVVLGFFGSLASSKNRGFTNTSFSSMILGRFFISIEVRISALMFLWVLICDRRLKSSENFFPQLCSRYGHFSHGCMHTSASRNSYSVKVWVRRVLGLGLC